MKQVEALGQQTGRFGSDGCLQSCLDYLLQDHQHKLSVDGLVLAAAGGTLVSGFGTLKSEAVLHLTFSVLLREQSFFGEAEDARCCSELCLHFLALLS